MLKALVVVGLVGVVTFAANITAAAQAAGQSSVVGASGVSFADTPDPGASRGISFSIGVVHAPNLADAGLAEQPQTGVQGESQRNYEVALVAHGRGDVDIALAHRGGASFNQQGDMTRSGRGSEIRLGRGLRTRAPNRSAHPTWYLFAASEDQALIWNPGVRNDFGGSSSQFALQDRVEIGDHQAGITYEIFGVQTSLAYVERKIRVHMRGLHGTTEDENFAGITITMRH